MEFPTSTHLPVLSCSSQIDPQHQATVIREGFEELIQSNDFVVVEGTGHTGEPRFPSAPSNCMVMVLQ